ncbi:MAG: c-type cytochrome [Bacteroidia bacterium]
MKKFVWIMIIIFAGTLSSIFFISCASSKLTSKDGGMLWSENCGRCHNAPGKSAYTSKEWSAIGLHMRMRAQIPAEEADKIIAFLKGED